jgi:hypothetical protein
VETEPSSSFIPLADLVELDKIYFKLIPLKEDAKTPDTSFLELYNNPKQLSSRTNEGRIESIDFSRA